MSAGENWLLVANSGRFPWALAKATRFGVFSSHDFYSAFKVSRVGGSGCHGPFPLRTIGHLASRPAPTSSNGAGDHACAKA
jgi:hypothetical protein